MANNNDINIKINIDAKNAEPVLNKTAEAIDETAKKADKASSSFIGFGSSIAGLLLSTVAITVNLFKLAQSYLGLTVRVETTSSKLKIFDFLVQNTHKDLSISLGFLKRFADFLSAINFPITPLTRFINLMGSFRVVIGIGKGEKTLFEHAADGIKKAADAAKNFQLNDFKQEVKQAAVSLALFAVQAAATFKSLKEGIAREASFSQASRTINGTREEIQGLKSEIEKLAATELAVPVEDLYAVAGIAGAMGKSVAEIPEFIRIVSEGAVALDIPAQQLAESLGTVQTQLDLTQEGLVSLSDQVNTVADSMPGKVKEMDIFEVLSTGVATAGKNFGLLKGETVALVGSLLSLGEAPETARTGIVNLLSSLQNAKNQTPEFQEGLRLMGTSAEKLADDIKDKPLPTLQGLLEKMNGLSNADRLDLATKFLGKGQDAIALAKLVDNVDLFKASLKSATDETVYSGSVHAAYIKQIETVDAKLTLLKNSFNNLTESLTTTFLPAISNVVDGFKWLANSLTQFSQNHPIFKTLAATTLSILSVAGALRLLKLGINALGLLFGFSAQGGILAATLSKLRFAILGVAGAWVTFQTVGIAGIFAVVRASSAFGMLRGALLFLFGGALVLLFTGISNLLPVTIKWGETTATVGQALKAVLDIIVESVISAAAAVAEFLGLSKDFAELQVVFEALKKALSGEWINFGGVMAAMEELVNSFIRGWQLIGARTAQVADEIGINTQFIKDAYNAMFDDSTVEDAQKKRQAALLRNEQQFTDEMARIIQNNPVANFKADVEERLKKSQAKKQLDKKDTHPEDQGGSLPSSGDDPAEAKKRADLISQIQKEQRERDIQLLRDAEARKIQELKNSGKTQKQIDDEVFAEKIRTGQLVYNELKKQLAAEKMELQTQRAGKVALTQEELTARKAALKEIQTAYKANIDALNQLEQQHL
jgi:TP901 family phage tail tape measure protein